MLRHIPIKLAPLLFVFLTGCVHAQTCQTAATGTGKMTGTGQLCPKAAALQSVTVAPASTTAPQGSSTAYTATGTFSDGSTQDLTLSATWASSVGSIASLGPVANPRSVTCGTAAPGLVSISATFQGITGTASLTCSPAPVITTFSLPACTTNLAYTATLQAIGGSLPYSWGVLSGSLPAGLTLNNTSPNATITGTPTANGITSFTIQATESGGGRNSRTLSIICSPATAQAPTLPQRWVDGRESLLSSYTNTPIIDNASTWSCHGSSKGPYAQTVAGLNSAIVDAEACRAANGDSSKIKIPHGTVISQAFSTNSYVNFKQTGGDASTSPINITSDNPLPTNDPLTTLARDQRVGTYNIASTSGLVRAAGLVTATGMNTMAAAASIGDLATIWNPDDKTFAGQYTVCGPPVCASPSTSSFQYEQYPEDLLNWMSSSFSNRTSNHQTGTSNPHYSWMDADGKKFWLIKGSTGHPWDINTYDASWIYHWITEDGDSASQAACQAAGFSSCFVDQSAFKRHNFPVPIMPRYMTWGQTITVDTPASGTVVTRTTNCETAGTTDTVNLGPVRGVAFFNGLIAWGGSVGTKQTLENDVYYGFSGGVYQSKEIFQYVKGLGLIQWQNTHWNGSSYAVVQTTTATTTTAGGAPAPVFPCSSNLVTNGTWIGGTPGVGGNANLPLQTSSVDATTQNGIVFSLQAQSQIAKIAASGCTTTGVIGAACTLTIDFSVDPGFSANDRFEIINSTCTGCITLDPNAFNTTWYVATVVSNASCATCEITFNSYTEFLGNGATATNGTALHFNHILADQKACCMWTLEETGSGGDMFFGDTNNYHNYRVANVEIRSAFNNPNLIATVLHISPNGESITPHPPMSVVGCTGAPAQTNCDEPIHIGFDHIWLHAYSFPTVARTVDGITVAAKLNCGWCYVTNSYFADIHADGQESHAISSKAAVGPFKIVNNYIEGSSENIFLSYLPDVQGLPNGYYCDGEIRRNWLNANPFDIMNSGGNIPNGVGKYYQYLLKNRIEFKNACQELIDGNVMGPSAGGVGEQQGSIFGNNSTPNNGTTNPAVIGSQSHDVTYSNNIMRHCFDGGYYPTRSPSTDSINFPTLHYAFINNLMYDCGNITLYGRNSWSGTNWSISFSDFIQLANRGQQYTATGTQSGGIATLTLTPPATCVAPAGFTGCGSGLQAGDWIAVTSCSDPLYNVAAPQQVPVFSSDPTLSNNVVSYPVPAGAAATVTGCLVGNGYGYPRFTTVSHNTVISNYNFASPVYANKYFTAPQTIGAAGLQKGFTAGAEVMARDWWMQDNIFSTNFAPGTTQAKFIWCAPANLEGTTPNFLGAEELCLDSHSLVFTNNAIAGLQGASGFSASKYREYNCPAGVCGANNGVSPPVTDLMSLSNNCPGVPNNACVGFSANYAVQTFGQLGSGSATNVPDFAPLGSDYHIFSLNCGASPSFFCAGQGGQASDGSSLGVNFTNLDAAFGLQQYPGGNP